MLDLSRVAIVNKSTTIHDDRMDKIVTAYQWYMDEVVSPSWRSPSPFLVAVKSTEAMPSDVHASVVFADQGNTPGALGLHWVTDWHPCSIVGVQDCLNDGITPESCGAHELAELWIDPWCVWCVQVGDSVVMVEISDPVEGRPLRHEPTGIELENIVTENYYLPGSPGPWDYLGLLKGPLSLGERGYNSSAPVGEWQQKYSELARAAKRATPPPWSRRGRRAAMAR